jgi:hypothetical protein
MTPRPLPASPCLQVQLDYGQEDGFLAGSRFFLSYSGTAPSAANCATLAADIGSAWNSHLAGVVHTTWGLHGVDVLDIATDSGASGNDSTVYAGTSAGNTPPAQVAMNIQYEIARRYRGGKPKMYLPPPEFGDIADPAHWNSAIITSVNSSILAFFTAIEALSVGSLDTLNHVNLSYYSGFTNLMNSSGRERAVPTYRSEAKVDNVTGYVAKAEMSSQRRRRVATTV